MAAGIGAEDPVAQPIDSRRRGRVNIRAGDFAGEDHLAEVINARIEVAADEGPATRRWSDVGHNDGTECSSEVGIPIHPCVRSDGERQWIQTKTEGHVASIVEAQKPYFA